MHENPLQEEQLEPLAQMLRQLQPAPSRLDRERLMFRAGQADAQARAVSLRTSERIAISRRPSGVRQLDTVQAWRGLTALATAVAILFAGLYTAEQWRSLDAPAQPLGTDGSGPQIASRGALPKPREIADAAPDRESVHPPASIPPHVSRDPVAAYLALPGIKVRGGLDRDVRAALGRDERTRPRPKTAGELMRELLNANENAAVETRLRNWTLKTPGAAANVPRRRTAQVA